MSLTNSHFEGWFPSFGAWTIWEKQDTISLVLTGLPGLTAEGKILGVAWPETPSTVQQQQEPAGRLQNTALPGLQTSTRTLLLLPALPVLRPLLPRVRDTHFIAPKWLLLASLQRAGPVGFVGTLQPNGCGLWLRSSPLSQQHPCSVGRALTPHFGCRPPGLGLLLLIPGRAPHHT